MSGVPSSALLPVRGGPLASVPTLYAPSAQAAKRFIEYFAANIRNPNTRRTYFRAVLQFSSWCEAQNFTEILAPIKEVALSRCPQCHDAPTATPPSIDGLRLNPSKIP